MNDNYTGGIHQQAQGFVQCSVVDAATGAVVKEYPRQKNLILNQGMDQLVNFSWAQLFAFCSAGTGVTPTSDDSGLTQASQAGSVITLVGGAFTFTNTLTDAGNTIKFDSGEEAQIVTVISPTSVSVDTTATIAAIEFIVYRTNQTQLSNQLKRTNTYLTGSPFCGTTLISNIYRMQRTFDFSAEVGLINYTEAAFGWSTSGATNIFSRVLLAAPVPVDVGQQLRVTYQLQIVLTPNVSFIKSAVVGGWPVAPAGDTLGSEAMQFIGLSNVDTSGASQTFDSAIGAGEPVTVSLGGVFVSTDATAPAAFGNAVSRGWLAEIGVTRAAYIPGSWYVDRTGTFVVGAGNSAAIRSMGYGAYIPGNFHPAQSTVMVFVFQQSQTKLNTHTLALTWRTSWSRVLS